MLVYLGSILPELGKVSVSADEATVHHLGLSTPHHVVMAFKETIMFALAPDFDSGRISSVRK